MLYVSVLGPYDSTYVGPFTTKEAADSYRANVPNNFDAWVVTQSELDANIKEFGEVEIQTP